MKTARRQRLGIAAVGMAVLALSVAHWSPDSFDFDPGSTEWVVEIVSRAGPWLVVLFLAVAIVASPIPSGPIAMASGALYGTLHGGLLVVVGAALGAMIAFWLSRRLGRNILMLSANPLAVWITRPRSQNMLALLVLSSRLIPFLSFDAISYAAGLTPLAAWRFAVATVLGVIPVSFGFAAMGAGILEGGNWLFGGLIACGVTVILPMGGWIWHAARPGRVRSNGSDASFDVGSGSPSIAHTAPDGTTK